MIKLFILADRKRRGFFIVKRATGPEILAFLFQWNTRIYDLYYVNSIEEIVDECPGNSASHEVGLTSA